MIAAAGSLLGCLLGALMTWGVSHIPIRLRGLLYTNYFLVTWDWSHYVFATLLAHPRCVHRELCPRASCRSIAARRYNSRFQMSSEACLSCEGIERYLGEEEERVHALRGVSLDIEPGSVHAVVGPSGCGKSSLLYILGLLDLPDAGRVSIESEPVSQLSDDELARRRSRFIGFIFQFHFLMEDFTAQENVMIPMRKLGQLSDSEMRERAADLLDGGRLGQQVAETQPSPFRRRTTACGDRPRAGK